MSTEPPAALYPRDERVRELFVFRDGPREAQVLSWRGYGLVAPDVLTTNGSAAYLARVLHGCHAVGKYTLPIQWRYATWEGLRDALIAAHRAAWEDADGK